MKNIVIVLCIFFTCLLCSCGTVKHDEDTGVTVGSNESSDVSIIDFSNNDSSDAVDIEVPKVSFSEDSSAFIWFDKRGYSDLRYYREANGVYMFSKMGEADYGTMRDFGNGTTVFYPDFFNVYEYDNTLYGVVDYGGHERSYCILNEDSTYTKLFECDNIYYYGDKIYYYQTAENNTKLCIFSSNLDGSNTRIITDSVTDFPTNPMIVEYEGDVIYTDFIGNINLVKTDGTNLSIVEGSDKTRSIQFVNGGYLYYTEYGRSSHAFSCNLMRIDLRGNNHECLISEKFDFSATVFDGKLLTFTPNGINVYDDALNISDTYDYGEFDFSEIEQIIVENGRIVIIGIDDDRNPMVSIYDKNTIS